MEDPENARALDDGELEKLAGLADLAGRIAHGFNNHLTVILGYTELVAEQVGRSSPDALEDVDGIRNAARRARELTQELLTIAGRQVLRTQVVDLNEIVAGTAERLRATIGADVSIETIPGPAPVEAELDPKEVERAVIELAVNARDAMPAGGSLALRVSSFELTEEVAATSPDASAGPYAAIEVDDTGEGIPAAVLPRIFTPFFTTKNGVTSRAGSDAMGLGLALVHGIVKQHGGHVRIRSEVGVGTTVAIYLPRCAGSDGS